MAERGAEVEMALACRGVHGRLMMGGGAATLCVAAGADPLQKSKASHLDLGGNVRKRSGADAVFGTPYSSIRDDPLAWIVLRFESRQCCARSRRAIGRE